MSRVHTTHSIIHECYQRRRKCSTVTPECSRTQQGCSESSPGRRFRRPRIRGPGATSSRAATPSATPVRFDLCGNESGNAAVPAKKGNREILLDAVEIQFGDPNAGRSAPQVDAKALPGRIPDTRSHAPTLARLPTNSRGEAHRANVNTQKHEAICYDPDQAAAAVDTLVVRGIASPLSGGPHGLCCWSDRRGRR